MKTTLKVLAVFFGTFWLTALSIIGLCKLTDPTSMAHPAILFFLGALVGIFSSAFYLSEIDYE